MKIPAYSSLLFEHYTKEINAKKISTTTNTNNTIKN